jgi:mRNA interferase MazF
VKRGEIWTVSGGTNYTGKPRLEVIVQEDRFNQTASITLCAFTTDPTEAPLLRMAIEPTHRNGLKIASRLMIDKVNSASPAR